MPMDTFNGGISFSEQSGRPVEIVRRGVLTDITSLAGFTAGQWLAAALGHPNLPPPGDQIQIGQWTLRLEQRDVVMAQDYSMADVTCVYRLHNLTEPIFSGGTSLTSVTTNLTPEGDLITVEHQGKTQGGTVTREEPTSTLRAVLVVPTDSPGAISQAWVNHVNSDSWQGGEPGEWRCDDVTFEEADTTTSPRRYRMAFSFSYREDGWETGVVYTDPETGQPPPELVEGEGSKTFQYAGEKAFGDTFPG